MICDSYRLVGLLGTGGLSEVWIGEDERIGQRVAIKLLKPEVSTHQANVDRILKEACSVSALNHPGIIKVFGFGFSEPGKRPYLAMELLDGESLTDRLTPDEDGSGRRCLSVKETIRLTRQLASAMSAAHKGGILHRDLKPDNLFLVPDSDVVGGERIKVLDFGLAKLITSSKQFERTSPNLFFGTPAYMAPEQCRDASSVDHRADLYAIGCIMYRCLCGRPPFGSGDIANVINAHFNKAPVPPRRLRPDVPSELETVIMRLLAKTPDSRLQSCDQLQGMLTHIDKCLSEAPDIDSGAMKTMVFKPSRSVRLPGLDVTTRTSSEGEMSGDISVPDIMSDLISNGVPITSSLVDDGLQTEKMVGLHLFGMTMRTGTTATTSKKTHEPDSGDLLEPGAHSAILSLGEPEPRPGPSGDASPTPTSGDMRDSNANRPLPPPPRTSAKPPPIPVPPPIPRSTQHTGAVPMLSPPSPGRAPTSSTPPPASRYGNTTRDATGSLVRPSISSDNKPEPAFGSVPLSIGAVTAPSDPRETPIPGSVPLLRPDSFELSIGHRATTEHAYSSISGGSGEAYRGLSSASEGNTRLWLISGAMALLTIVGFALALVWLRSNSPTGDTAPTPATIAPATTEPPEPANIDDDARDAMAKDINIAYVDRDVGRVSSLCQRFSGAGYREPNVDTLCALTACRKKQRAAARRHLDGIEDWQREGVSEACARHGIVLDGP